MTASSALDPESLESRILGAARDAGFARAGIAAPVRSEQAAERLASWLRAEHHGEMQYMDGALDRADPAALFENVRSVLVVALPYGARAPRLVRRSESGPELPSPGPLTGKVARYAQGEDYHRILKNKLERLGLVIDALVGRSVGRRACVDSAPLLERDFAVRAGLGFAAKSTLTIAPGVGSFFLLGELLLDLELEPTATTTNGCGSCTRCITACPTGAFVGPYVLDARRCISYLTIELKGSVPRDLRPLIGQHVFGCDICQDVCPWNHSHHAPAADPELGQREALRDPELESLLFLTSSGYRRLVAGTALSRVSRARLARNAAIALGNSRSPAAEAPLARALSTHISELVRAHAAWALGALRLPLTTGLAALQHAAEHDDSPAVRAEACDALAAVTGQNGGMTAPTEPTEPTAR